MPAFDISGTERNIICKIICFCVENLHFPLFYGVTRGSKEFGKLLTELEISKRSALEVSNGKIRSWSSRD